jgi:hypothetical protein
VILYVIPAKAVETALNKQLPFPVVVNGLNGDATGESFGNKVSENSSTIKL